MKRQKNSEFAYAKGREMRLAAELQRYQLTGSAAMGPLERKFFFSHDATLQSFFNKGWSSVTACEVRLHLALISLNPVLTYFHKFGDSENAYRNPSASGARP